MKETYFPYNNVHDEMTNVLQNKGNKSKRIRKSTFWQQYHQMLTSQTTFKRQKKILKQNKSRNTS